MTGVESPEQQAPEPIDFCDFVSHALYEQGLTDGSIRRVRDSSTLMINWNGREVLLGVLFGTPPSGVAQAALEPIRREDLNQLPTRELEYPDEMDGSVI